MTWSFDLTTAPRDGHHFLMATTDGKRYLTRWLAPTKFTPAGRFDGFSENAKTLRAWCAVPEHPDHQSDAGAFAAVTGKAQLASADSAEPSASGHIDPNEDRIEGQSPAFQGRANAGGDNVDGSAERAARQSNDTTHAAGAIEAGIDQVIIDRHASGPDVKRAPLITHKHIFLDDCGSGA